MAGGPFERREYDRQSQWSSEGAQERCADFCMRNAWLINVGETFAGARETLRCIHRKCAKRSRFRISVLLRLASYCKNYIAGLQIFRLSNGLRLPPLRERRPIEVATSDKCTRLGVLLLRRSLLPSPPQKPNHSRRKEVSTSTISSVRKSPDRATYLAGRPTPHSGAHVCTLLQEVGHLKTGYRGGAREGLRSATMPPTIRREGKYANSERWPPLQKYRDRVYCRAARSGQIVRLEPKRRPELPNQNVNACLKILCPRLGKLG